MNRKILAIITVGLLLFSVSFVQAAQVLMQIGRSPFHQPPLTSASELIAMVQSKEAEVKKGFALANRNDLFAPFMEQIATTQIDTVEFQKGTHFDWMFYKRKGKGTVRIVNDVTWGNPTSFTGFQFDIESEGNAYTFSVPLGCGNIALLGTRAMPPVAAAPTPPPVQPNQPPQCGMTVSSVRAFCGEIITVDASSSTDADGDIAKMTIAFVDDQGQVVTETVIDGGGLVGEVAVPCGTNSLKVTITDNDGEQSTSAECTAEVTGANRLRFLADLGYYRQFDPAHHLFGRVGMEYQFTDQWSVLGLIGGAPHIDGIDGESAFIADVLGEYKFSRYFVDLGLGAWITDGDDDIDAEDSQLDLIAAIGARVYGEPDAFNASVFFEVRSAFDEMDELIDYGRFGLGVRLRF